MTVLLRQEQAIINYLLIENNVSSFMIRKSAINQYYFFRQYLFQQHSDRFCRTDWEYNHHSNYKVHRFEEDCDQFQCYCGYNDAHNSDLVRDWVSYNRRVSFIYWENI